MKAVITGDIINSTQLTKEKRKHLEEIVRKHLLAFSHFEKNYEINRGDSFQALAFDPTQAFEAGLKLRANLKHAFEEDIDARFAIGIGEVSMQGETIGSSDGKAFQLSGRKLDTLEPNNRALGICIGDELTDKSLDVICSLSDKIITGWSKLQCEAIEFRMQGLTFEEIAGKIGVSKSAIFKRISSADFEEIEQVNQYYKYLVTHVDI